MSLSEDKAKIMEDDNIGKLIWKFAIPGIIASLIIAIYNIVDTAFVGMLNNTLAMAAVSVVFPLFILINAIGQMMGVGASLATVISQAISVCLLASYFIRKKSYLKLEIKNFKLSKTIYKEIISVGTATFLTQALISISMGLLNIASKPYGDSLIASFGISLKLSSLVIFVVMGYNQGFQPIASYNYGAGNYDKLRKAIKISIKRTTVFASLATIVLMIFAQPAINLFSSDSSVIEVGAKTLRATLLRYPFLGFIQLYATLYQSLGMSKEALIVGTARQGIFFIPIVFILPKLLGMNGVLYTQALSDLFTVILTAYFAYKTNEMLNLKNEKNKHIKTNTIEVL